MKSQKPIQLRKSQKLCHQRAKGNVVGWFAHKILTTHIYMKWSQKLNDRGNETTETNSTLKKSKTVSPMKEKRLKETSQNYCLIFSEYWNALYELFAQIWDLQIKGE